MHFNVAFGSAQKKTPAESKYWGKGKPMEYTVGRSQNSALDV